MTNNIDSPMVTVAMVTYNSSQYVRMAIESVLASSYTNFELLISDDCSTDNTWEIINEYKDSRIRAYRNEINLREYPNRNRCISLAKGKYLLFIDGDDMLIDGALDYAVKKMEDFPDCAMACGFLERNNMMYPIRLTPIQSYRYNYFGQSFLSNSLSQTFFKTQVLIDVGGAPENYISGDYFLKAKISAIYDILIIYPLLGWWRETPNQASSVLKNSNISLEEKFKMETELLSMANFPLSNSEKTIILAKLKKEIFKHILKKLICFKYKNLIKFIIYYNSIKTKKKYFIKLPEYKLLPNTMYPLTNYSVNDPFNNIFK